MELIELSSSMTNLTDSLLIEILIRLPDCESANRCKCVCKRWHLLLSDPHFLSCFIKHRKNSLVKLPSTFLLQFRYFRYDFENGEKGTTRYKVHSFSDHPVLSSVSTCDLDFLPCNQPCYAGEVVIASSYKDLLICYYRFSYGKGTTYYICNPVTKQWVALPPAPSQYQSGLVGFVSEEAACSSTTNYRLVQIPEIDSPDKFEVEIFLSETGEWSTSEILSPLGYTLWRGKSVSAVSFKKKLCWMVNNRSILALDPFDNDKKQMQCRVIELPNLETEIRGAKDYCLGVCQEHLKVSLLLTELGNFRVNIWELQDNYDAEEWRLEYEICLDEMVFVSNHLFNQLRFFANQVLGFHPDNAEVLYLRYQNQIVVCNVLEETLEVVSECVRDRSLTIRDPTTFFLVHPSWPSPIPPPRHYSPGASTSK